MELEFGLVARAHVRTPGRVLEMDREQALGASNRKILDGAERKPVQPGLERHAFRLLAAVCSVAQSARDGFVDDFFFGYRVRNDLFGRLAEIEFTLDEAFQAAETGIHVRANVVG